MGPVSGRYACYQADGQCDLVAKMQLTDVNGPTCSVIVWTDTAANMFVKAEQQSRSTPELPPSTTSGTTSSGEAPVRDRGGDVSRSATDWLEAVKDAERRGELLTAFDLAEQGLAERPDDLWLKHRAVLALARAGATDEAARRFARYGLKASEEEDVAALGARIAKDLALAGPAAARRGEAIRARDLYRRFTLARAATTPRSTPRPSASWQESAERARTLARIALEVLDRTGERSYYAAATAGEAQLLLGNEGAAHVALGRAAQLHGGDYSSLATTRRQLRLVCALTGADPEIIGILAGPGVAHFCGHRIAAPGMSGRFRAEAEEDVAALIEAELMRDAPRYAYGSLASGADIMWAEALLARGAELHIVLPFVRDAFIQSSVASSGPAWVERFRCCLDAAFNVTYATDNAFVPDDALYRYGAELAIGLALLRARYLDASVRQLAVWDGGPDLAVPGLLSISPRGAPRDRSSR